MAVSLDKKPLITATPRTARMVAARAQITRAEAERRARVATKTRLAYSTSSK